MIQHVWGSSPGGELYCVRVDYLMRDVLREVSCRPFRDPILLLDAGLGEELGAPSFELLGQNPLATCPCPPTGHVEPHEILVDRDVRVFTVHSCQRACGELILFSRGRLSAQFFQLVPYRGFR